MSFIMLLFSYINIQIEERQVKSSAFAFNRQVISAKGDAAETVQGLPALHCWFAA